MKNGLQANSIVFIDSRKWFLCLPYSSVSFQDYMETAFLFETPRIQVNLSLYISASPSQQQRGDCAGTGERS